MLFRRSSCRTTLTPLSVRFTTSGWALGGAVIFFGGTTGGLVVSGAGTPWAARSAGKRKKGARADRREARLQPAETERGSASRLFPLAASLQAFQQRVVAWRSSD